jgi:transposase
MEELFVGIDVSKDRLDVHAYPTGETFAVARDGEGLEQLVEQLRRLAPRQVAVEATGGFETTTAAALAAAALPVVIVNPAQVRHFALSLGRRAKTDRVDAAMIARFLAMTRPEPRPIPDEEARMLGDLVARRRQIVTMIVAEKNRARRMTTPRLLRSIARLVAALEKELAAVDDDIDTGVRSSPAWLAREELLVSVPGIGPVIARTLISEIPELGSLDRRSVASLAGLAPFTRQSGQWKGKSMIAAGRAPVRAALFIAVMVASRFNPTIKAFHQRLRDAGKPKMVALIACARKLLTILNAILRDQKPWQNA